MITAPLAAAATLVDDTFETRWTRWLADAIAQDLRLQRRAEAVALLLGCCAFALLMVAVYVG
jgi:hypothetical protein